MSILQTLFSVHGRIRRRDYWLYSIGFGLCILLFEFVGHQYLSGHPAALFFKDVSGWMTFKKEPFNIFLLVMFAICQWPSFCIATKRWHDRGRSGWIAAFTLASSLIMTFVQVYYGPKGAHLNWPIYGVSSIMGFAIAIWIFVECGCLEGTKGANRYGQSPKGIMSPASVF